MTSWQPAGIRFGDVELLLTERIRDLLAARPEPVTTDVHVDNEIPPLDELPARLVTIRYDGGPRLDLVRRACRIGINVLANPHEDAVALIEIVLALLGTLPDGTTITAVTDVTAPTQIPEEAPTTWLTATATVVQRGNPL